MEVDLSEVVNDPQLAESVLVHRYVGLFAQGGYVQQEADGSPFAAFGVMDVVSGKTLATLSDADRPNASMTFITSTEIKTTRLDDQQGETGTSDILEWNSEQWRVIRVDPYYTRGFWKAVIGRLKGA